MEHALYWYEGRRFFADVPAGAPFLQLGVADSKAHFIRGRSGNELYLRLGDPEQEQNLATDSPLVNEMIRLLDARGAGVDSEPGRAELSEKHKERLRQLGYADVEGGKVPFE